MLANVAKYAKKEKSQVGKIFRITHETNMKNKKFIKDVVQSLCLKTVF